ncbi:MAG: helix-turn-helix domain-containing protein [Acidobacteriia bacterium]|nr:helix-turn-helix domain-containing protein [Terriglobia bacterium]
MLSISVRKVDYLIADGRLKASRIDGRVLIHRDELARFASKA